VGVKSGIVTNLDRCKLSAAVGVVVAAVIPYFSAGGWGVFLLSVYSSAFIFGADLCIFLSAEKYGITAATTTPTAALSLHLSKLVTIPDFTPTQCNAYRIPNAIVICIVLQRIMYLMVLKYSAL